MYNKKYGKQYRQAHKKETEKWWNEHRWYKHYHNAKTRCNYSKHINYKDYGAKGIKFLMTPKDFKTLWFRDKAYNLKKPSIDRKDNNGNYTLKNCRFIEMRENISRASKGNKNSAKLTEEQILEIRKSYTQNNINQEKLAKKYNISQMTISHIINYKTWKYI